MNIYNPSSIGGAAGLAVAPNVLLVAAAAAATTWLPGSMFAGWTEDGTDITVPIAAFNDLTPAFADAVTGDARQVASSICSTVFEWFNELTTQPEGMTVKISSRRQQISGDFEGSEKITYQFSFYRSYPEGLVSNEPE